MPDSWDYSQRPTAPERHAPATLTFLIGALCVVMTVAFHSSGNDRGTLWYDIGHGAVLDADEIWSGRYFGMFTSIFVHGGLLHIVFNMLWLLRLGAILETTLNPFVYALFVFTSAVVGSGAELMVSGTTGIGASGVVYAMFGLLWAGRGRYPVWNAVATRENFNTFLIWGIFCVIATYSGGMMVANGAHFGGFAFGMAVGWLFFAPKRRYGWSIVLVLLVAITVLSATWMPWSEGWTYWKATRAFKARDYATAIGWYERSLRLGADPEAAWYNIGQAWAQLAARASQRGDQAAARDAIAHSAAAFQKAGPNAKDLPDAKE